MTHKPLTVKCKEKTCAHPKCTCGHCTRYHSKRDGCMKTLHGEKVCCRRITIAKSGKITTAKTGRA